MLVTSAWRLVATIAAVLALSCDKESGRKAAGAKALYERLIRARGAEVPYLRPLSENEAQSFADRLLGFPRYANFSRQELVNLMKSAPFGGTVSAALKDLLANSPEEERRRFDSAFAGYLPPGEIQATSVLADDGSVLVLVDHGLGIAYMQWARAIADLVWVDDLDTPRFREISEAVRKSVVLYRVRGVLPDFIQLATKENGPTTEMLGFHAIEFVIAHECGHALLGHLSRSVSPSAKFRPPTDFWREAQADHAALGLMTVELLNDRGGPLTDKQRITLDVRFTGAYLGLAFMEAVERAAVPGAGPPTLDEYQMMMRRAEMGREITQTIAAINSRSPVLEEFPMTARVGRVIERVLAVVAVPRKAPEALGVDDRRRRLVLLAYKAGDRKRVAELVRQDAKWHREWLLQLRNIADKVMQPPLSNRMAADWTNGEYLSRDDVIGLAHALEVALSGKVATQE